MIVCKELIISKTTIRGAGTDDSPTRVVVQVLEKDGKVVAEDDPEGNYTVEDLYRLEAFIKEGRGALKDFLAILPK